MKNIVVFWGSKLDLLTLTYLIVVIAISIICIVTPI